MEDETEHYNEREKSYSDSEHDNWSNSEHNSSMEDLRDVFSNEDVEAQKDISYSNNNTLNNNLSKELINNAMALKRRIPMEQKERKSSTNWCY